MWPLPTLHQGQLRLYLAKPWKHPRTEVLSAVLALLCCFHTPNRKCFFWFTLCFVMFLHLRQVLRAGITGVKTLYNYTKCHTWKATGDDLPAIKDEMLTLSPFCFCSNLHWASGLCWHAAWCLLVPGGDNESSHCIGSFLGLHLFCFWNYNVDYHCWSKTNSRGLLKQSIQQLSFLNSIFCHLPLGWKNPQERCPQKRIPRTVHGDHYSYLLSLVLDSLRSYSTTCNIW